MRSKVSSRPTRRSPSGNSGGPLVNALGQVVGINTLVSSTEIGSTANGLGFAISTAELLPAMEQFAPRSTANRLRRVISACNSNGATMVAVVRLVADVIAARRPPTAGIEVGDVVVAVDGEPITGQAALVATIRNLAPGEQVTVSLVHDGVALEVTAVLGERTSNP